MALDIRCLKFFGYQIVNLLDCTMEEKIGGHGKLAVKALLSEEEKEKVLHETKENHVVELFYIKEGKKQLIFSGYVTYLDIYQSAELYQLYLEASSADYTMDLARHTRSFQDVKMTYTKVIQSILKNYPGADGIINIDDKPIGTMLVQYEETDWEFMKRILSELGENLYSCVHSRGIRVFAGTPDIFHKKIDIQKREIKKDMDTFYRRQAEDDNTQAPDYTIFCIETNQILELGSSLSMDGKKFYVKKVKRYLQGSLFYNDYELQSKNGLKSLRIYPMNQVGAALEGKILQAQADKVKVHLKADAEQETAKACWIPYSTMAASSDGSGWYCMPETGDTVRIYFPTKETKDAVALSAVSSYETPAAGPDKMGDSSVKYLSTIHDKEMKLSPDGIKMSAGKSSAIVKVGQDGSVSIFANDTLDVTAKESITVTAKKDLNMDALEEISIKCDKGASLTIDDSVSLKGIKTYLD